MGMISWTTITKINYCRIFDVKVSNVIIEIKWENDYKKNIPITIIFLLENKALTAISLFSYFSFKNYKKHEFFKNYKKHD